MTALAWALSAAARGKAVWLADLRERMEHTDMAAEAFFRLHLLDGSCRELCVPLAEPETAEEAQLLRDYLRAHLFNLLSACGGTRMEIFLPDQAFSGWRELTEQAARELRSGGWQKAIRVADRICAAAGAAPFSWELLPLSARSPVDRRPEPTAAPLGPTLRERTRRSEQGLRCGMDVGGTDIKLVLVRDGRLLLAEEFDWDPAHLRTAEEIMNPILSLLRDSLARALPEEERPRLDSLGLSFPDVVIRDRILGGETPKTRGMREHDPQNYEKEFQKLGDLNARLAAFCREGGRVRTLNDGAMAAFSAAVELACAGEDDAIERGVFAHSLGTDLGSGWLRADGTVPALSLELYDLLLDLGSLPERGRPAEDLRSTRNENSGLPGARRYLGQAAAFRIAWERNPALLAGFTQERDGLLTLRSEPEDLRKPCLEHLMRLAEQGNADAEAVFRRIGSHLGQISREIAYLLGPETQERFLFGRFVRHPRCFALLREGCAGVLPSLRLLPADGGLAHSPLMRQLAGRGEGAVARFGQAIGAVYYGLHGEEE